tara:strand:- start:1907 stop:2287 length:381 start_codon:yes stop_codon:yes gene_type:complete
MAGKIVADTLEHSTAGSVTTDYVVNGSAKAWLNINASVTLQDSLNISSMTDNATGNFSSNFSSSFGNAYYAPSGQAGWNTANTNARIVWTTHAAPTTSTHRFGVAIDNGNEEDSYVMNETYMGDLA